jgi:phosphatidylglycerophosphatase A
MKWFCKLLATGFYTGYIPGAPGTAGTLIGVILYLGIHKLSWPCYLLIFIVLFLLGVYLSDRATNYFFKEKDSKRIVIDEIVGFLVAMFLVPFETRFIIAAFLVFRVFDILKPFPLRRLETLPGGWGVMGDDLLAGVYTNLLIQAVRLVALRS